MAFSIPRWVTVLQQIGPVVVGMLFPALAPISGLIVAAASAAESIPGATGPQKAQIAKQIVSIGAQMTNTVTGKPLIDPVLASQITDNVFTIVVQATNAIAAVPVVPIAKPV